MTAGAAAAVEQRGRSSKLSRPGGGEQTDDSFGTFISDLGLAVSENLHKTWKKGYEAELTKTSHSDH